MTTKLNASAYFIFSVLFLSCHTEKKSSFTNEAFNENPISELPSIHPEPGADIRTQNLRFIKANTQEFTINSKKTTLITGKKGVKIYIDPSVLEKEDGSPVKGKINLKLVELTSSLDLFKSRLATVSDGNLLTSGGSYYIGMDSQGAKLKIKKGKSISVEFPVLSKQKMELYYGELDSTGNMNWQSTREKLLLPAETITFNNNGFAMEVQPAMELSGLKGRFFSSMNSKVYLNKTLMTLQEMVDSINKKTTRVIIDTVFGLTGFTKTGITIDTSSRLARNNSFKFYRMRTCKDYQEELEDFEQRKTKFQTALSRSEPKTLAGQIQKYYAPAAVTRLGWINCDDFYQRELIDTELDIPITFKNCCMEYFVIFNSFMGLLQNKICITDTAKTILQKLPVGQAVTLVAFAKSKGIIYQSKSDFVIQKDNKLSLIFDPVHEEEFEKIFRNNAKL